MKSAETFCAQNGLTRPRQNTTIRRLAKSINATYNIPPGDELVLIVGEGNEPDNLAAIESWVRQTLIDPDEQLAQNALSHLVSRFGEALEQWELKRW